MKSKISPITIAFLLGVLLMEVSSTSLEEKKELKQTNNINNETENIVLLNRKFKSKVSEEDDVESDQDSNLDESNKDSASNSVVIRGDEYENILKINIGIDKTPESTQELSANIKKEQTDQSQNLNIQPDSLLKLSGKNVENQDSLLPENDVKNQDSLLPENDAKNQDSLLPENDAKNQDSLLPENDAKNQDSLLPENDAKNQDSLLPENDAKNQDSLLLENENLKQQQASPVEENLSPNVEQESSSNFSENDAKNQDSLLPENDAKNQDSLFPENENLKQQQESLVKENENKKSLAEPQLNLRPFAEKLRDHQTFPVQNQFGEPDNQDPLIQENENKKSLAEPQLNLRPFAEKLRDHQTFPVQNRFRNVEMQADNSNFFSRQSQFQVVDELQPRPFMRNLGNSNGQPLPINQKLIDSSQPLNSNFVQQKESKTEQPELTKIVESHTEQPTLTKTTEQQKELIQNIEKQPELTKKVESKTQQPELTKIVESNIEQPTLTKTVKQQTESNNLIKKKEIIEEQPNLLVKFDGPNVFPSDALSLNPLIEESAKVSKESESKKSDLKDDDFDLIYVKPAPPELLKIYEEARNKKLEESIDDSNFVKKLNFKLKNPTTLSEPNSIIQEIYLNAKKLAEQKKEQLLAEQKEKSKLLVKVSDKIDENSPSNNDQKFDYYVRKREEQQSSFLINLLRAKKTDFQTDRRKYATQKRNFYL